MDRQHSRAGELHGVLLPLFIRHRAGERPVGADARGLLLPDCLRDAIRVSALDQDREGVGRNAVHGGIPVVGSDEKMRHAGDFAQGR